MDYLMKFLMMSGKYLTKIASQSIIEAYNRSVAYGNQLNKRYEQALCVTGSYESMLEMYNDNMQDMEENNHLAFISDKHKEEFEMYMRKIDSKASISTVNTSEEMVLRKELEVKENEDVDIPKIKVEKQKLQAEQAKRSKYTIILSERKPIQRINYDNSKYTIILPTIPTWQQNFLNVVPNINLEKAITAQNKNFIDYNNTVKLNIDKPKIEIKRRNKTSNNSKYTIILSERKPTQKKNYENSNYTVILPNIQQKETLIEEKIAKNLTQNNEKKIGLFGKRSNSFGNIKKTINRSKEIAAQIQSAELRRIKEALKLRTKDLFQTKQKPCIVTRNPTEKLVNILNTEDLIEKQKNVSQSIENIERNVENVKIMLVNNLDYYNEIETKLREKSSMSITLLNKALQNNQLCEKPIDCKAINGNPTYNDVYFNSRLKELDNKICMNKQVLAKNKQAFDLLENNVLLETNWSIIKNDVNLQASLQAVNKEYFDISEQHLLLQTKKMTEVSAQTESQDYVTVSKQQLLETKFAQTEFQDLNKVNDVAKSLKQLDQEFSLENSSTDFNINVKDVEDEMPQLDFNRFMRSTVHKLLNLTKNERYFDNNLIPLPFEYKFKIDSKDNEERGNVMDANKRAFEELETQIKVIKIIKDNLAIDVPRKKSPISTNSNNKNMLKIKSFSTHFERKVQSKASFTVQTDLIEEYTNNIHVNTGSKSNLNKEFNSILNEKILTFDNVTESEEQVIESATLSSIISFNELVKKTNEFINQSKIPLPINKLQTNRFYKPQVEINDQSNLDIKTNKVSEDGAIKTKIKKLIVKNKNVNKTVKNKLASQKSKNNRNVLKQKENIRLGTESNTHKDSTLIDEDKLKCSRIHCDFSKKNNNMVTKKLLNNCSQIRNDSKPNKSLGIFKDMELKEIKMSSKRKLSSKSNQCNAFDACKNKQSLYNSDTDQVNVKPQEKKQGLNKNILLVKLEKQGALIKGKLSSVSTGNIPGSNIEAQVNDFKIKLSEYFTKPDEDKVVEVLYAKNDIIEKKENINKINSITNINENEVSNVNSIKSLNSIESENNFIGSISVQDKLLNENQIKVSEKKDSSKTNLKPVISNGELKNINIKCMKSINNVKENKVDCKTSTAICSNLDIKKTCEINKLLKEGEIIKELNTTSVDSKNENVRKHTQKGIYKSSNSQKFNKVETNKSIFNSNSRNESQTESVESEMKIVYTENLAPELDQKGDNFESKTKAIQNKLMDKFINYLKDNEAIIKEDNKIGKIQKVTVNLESENAIINQNKYANNEELVENIPKKIKVNFNNNLEKNVQLLDEKDGELIQEYNENLFDIKLESDGSIQMFKSKGMDSSTTQNEKAIKIKNIKESINKDVKIIAKEDNVQINDYLKLDNNENSKHIQDKEHVINKEITSKNQIKNSVKENESVILKEETAAKVRSVTKEELIASEVESTLDNKRTAHKEEIFTKGQNKKIKDDNKLKFDNKIIYSTQKECTDQSKLLNIVKHNSTKEEYNNTPIKNDFEIKTNEVNKNENNLIKTPENEKPSKIYTAVQLLVKTAKNELQKGVDNVSSKFNCSIKSNNKTLVEDKINLRNEFQLLDEDWNPEKNNCSITKIENEVEKVKLLEPDLIHDQPSKLIVDGKAKKLEMNKFDVKNDFLGDEHKLITEGKATKLEIKSKENLLNAAEVKILLKNDASNSIGEKLLKKQDSTKEQLSKLMTNEAVGNFEMQNEENLCEELNGNLLKLELEVINKPLNVTALIEDSKKIEKLELPENGKFNQIKKFNVKYNKIANEKIAGINDLIKNSQTKFTDVSKTNHYDRKIAEIKDLSKTNQNVFTANNQTENHDIIFKLNMNGTNVKKNKNNAEQNLKELDAKEALKINNTSKTNLEIKAQELSLLPENHLNKMNKLPTKTNLEKNCDIDLNKSKPLGNEVGKLKKVFAKMLYKSYIEHKNKNEEILSNTIVYEENNKKIEKSNDINKSKSIKVDSNKISVNENTTDIKNLPEINQVGKLNKNFAKLLYKNKENETQIENNSSKQTEKLYEKNVIAAKPEINNINVVKHIEKIKSNSIKVNTNVVVKKDVTNLESSNDKVGKINRHFTELMYKSNMQIENEPENKTTSKNSILNTKLDDSLNMNKSFNSPINLLKQSIWNLQPESAQMIAPENGPITKTNKKYHFESKQVSSLGKPITVTYLVED